MAFSISQKTSCQLMQTVQYFDGLGRPLQTVQVKGSTLNRDVVQPFAYDQFGRETTKYLPYAPISGISDGSYKPDALTANAGQSQFYTSPPDGVSSIAYPSVSTGFELSPLNRIVEQGASGQPWQLSTSGVAGSGHTVKVAYDDSAANEVILWSVNPTGTGAIGTTYYDANQLFKTTTTDENGNNNIEYKDKDGQVVCKKVQSGTSSYLTTYYVYDDLNNLSYVIPPIPAGTTYPNSFTETDAVFTNFIYGYHYDERKRLVEKKVPGKGWEFMIYNTLDEMVASQDAVQRGKSTQEWTFIKYDAIGRVAYSGIYQYPGSIAGTSYRTSLQATVNGQTSLWENQQTTGTGYSGTAWRQTNILRYLILNYYDSYTYPNNPYTPAVSSTLANPAGLLTATKTAVLLPDGTYGAMLWAVSFYDGFGKVVQIDKQHYLGGETNVNANNYDETDNFYNFNDQLTGTTRHHYVAGVQSILVTTNYQYDHMGRKTRTSEAISTGLTQAPAPTVISQLDYNEIGQLRTKHLHSADNGSSFLQDIDYVYNERGWLAKINNPAVAATATKLFAEQLNYNLPQFGAQARFNGDITEQQYNAGISGNQHVNYGYDQMNRLMVGTSTTGFSETISNYNNLGNILGLTRTAPNSVTLAYGYAGSQLQTVTNGGVSFRSYAYDLNGNASSDGQGNTIYYNMIDLPRSIPGKNLSYTYSSTGEKLRKNSNGATTEYISGIQYKADGTIDFIQTEEGRANRSGTSYLYEYTLTDHLGNNRVTFDQTNGKVGEEDYYPFGINVHRLTNAGNKYLYNKKELQDETGLYDYGARFYDPVIARWTSVDPLTEKAESWSPYNYVLNNPIKLFDPDGAFPYPVTIRAFAPLGSFNGPTGLGFDDDHRGFSTSNNVTSRAQQTFTVDPSGKSITGGQVTSSDTHWFGMYSGNATNISDKGGISNQSFIDANSDVGNGAIATVSSHFDASNPDFLSTAPSVGVSSNVLIEENLKGGFINVSVDLSSKNFPATEALIGDAKGQSVFITGAAAFGKVTGLTTADEKKVSSGAIRINIDNKGNFTGVVSGGKTYSISDWN